MASVSTGLASGDMLAEFRLFLINPLGKGSGVLIQGVGKRELVGLDA